MACDVLIVGGGVIGLSIARELALTSLQVTVLDRQQPGREASWAGAGILPPASFEGPDDPLTQMTIATHRLWPDLSAQLLETTGIDNGFRRCGGIRLGPGVAAAPELTFRPPELTSLAAEQAAWRATGVEAELIRGEELHNLEPALSHQVTEGLWLPEVRQVRNPWHLRALLADCKRLGVVIRSDAPVEALRIECDRVRGVQLPNEIISADRVVIASGAWTPLLLPSELNPVAIEPVRGQIVLLRQERLSVRRVIECGSRYLVPREDGRILIGSTEERAGYVKETTDEGVNGLLGFATALVPSLATAVREQAWAGLRPHAVGGRPFIGPAPKCEGLYVAAGHFRAGLHLSPLTAQLIRRLLVAD
ncbi:MAG: glycine oxidase ThiO [Planctomycetaceae bacterium]|nr:glycine oxidase ThiO [Planctomycetaceae bacterium]